jgi:acetyl esterase/lipase
VRVDSDAVADATHTRHTGERVDTPALLTAGEDDQMWPAAEYARDLADAILDAEVCVYEEAGHGLTPPHVPTTNSTAAGGMALGGTPTANADHWPVVLDHLAVD